MSLMNKMNKSGPKFDPWGIPMFIGNYCMILFVFGHLNMNKTN